ncbi:zinc transport system membrane protein TroD [Gottschalkia acidurici 9a]|uniref:Zinc transport system membrane protein TroD n=1 Tax=Gottschalkia acidurici (strain ATCC 7906 / DSM 604 / BCRC 14475 / CIP 104303 / KCTC 5404 / NCIMB 10678 / 9a) TaxID=1128398 RepID=K0AW08_GOTA9|nr:metal ABC transporter permease [Gottschalkia acidurici]AFS77429.1 zinc transport system membrane protein TroD [Gottschalkia acidurici 9a]
MNLAQVEILIIAVLTSASCALIGSFLILRKMAMMSDAISHTILLGIVVAFFITQDLSSPLLIIGATLTGLATVFLVEMLQKTKLVSEDASIGTIFPFLFSIGIILISLYAGNIHLDIDSVLLGELAFAPFDRLVIRGLDLGAKSIYVMGVIFLLDLIYIVLFYKELKIVTFDSALATAIGISPIIVHYSLMTLVSVTTVGAFNAVGAILVVALMIVPPSTAYFWVEDLKKMIIWSTIFGALSAIIGLLIAFRLDISIAGSMSVMSGVIFLIVFIFSPKKGLLTILKRRKRQKYEFAELSLLMHLLNHQEIEYEEIELKKPTIVEHLRWEEQFLNEIIERLSKYKYISIEDDLLKINDNGIEYIRNNSILKESENIQLCK